MRRNKNRGYQKLRVWREAIDYYRETCGVFRKMYWSLRRGVSQQIACSDSIHRNIAEARREILALVEREGLRVEEVLAAPARQTGSHAFCPYCHAQYREGVERCADCREVLLVAFTTKGESDAGQRRPE